MMRILVTGGLGFIGSHTSISLLEKGFEVFILDSNINSSEFFFERMKKLIKRIDINLIKKVKFFKGDTRNSNFVEKIFEEAIQEGNPIKGVIHFAGLKAVTESILKPLTYWDINLVGTLRLLQNMDKYDCKNLIFSSSATVYGFSKKNLIDESSLINPINPYGFTKASIEILLKNLFESKSNDWRIANLRYFNPIGAHVSGLIGEDPRGKPNNIFPLINKVAFGEFRELEIYGNDWNTHDGTGIRDYIHVMDLAEGHILTLEYLLKNKKQIINLNLGTGKGTSVLDLVHKYEEVNNVKIPYVIKPRREGDTDILIADNSLACSLLNWRPKRNLKDMCLDGWKWEKHSLQSNIIF